MAEWHRLLAWWKALSDARKLASFPLGAFCLFVVYWLIDKALTLFFEKILEKTFSWSQLEKIMTALEGFFLDRFVLGMVSMAALVVFGPSIWRFLFIQNEKQSVALNGSPIHFEGGTTYVDEEYDDKINQKKKTTEREIKIYKTWDSVDPLNIIQAASLWEGYEPIDPFYTTNIPAIHAKYITLKQAIQRKELKLSTSNLQIVMQAKRSRYNQIHYLEVSRDELRRYIDEKNLRPAPFVFPEDR